MDNVQIIIDNQVAHIYATKDAAVPVTYSISDINNIGERTNPTTKTVKIPASSLVKRILGYPDDLSITTFKGQRTNIPGVIRESGIDILSGVVNVKGYHRTGNDFYFEITIIGSSGEWINTMREADLRGLSADAAHFKTSSAITGSQAGTLAYAYALINNGFAGGEVSISSIEEGTTGRSICVIDGANSIYNLRQNVAGGQYVIGYGFDNSYYNKKFYVSDTINTIDRVAIEIMTTFRGSGKGRFRLVLSDVRVEDFSIAINIEKIFTKLFNNAGYRISSDFLSGTFFKNLWMIPGCEVQTKEWQEARKCVMGLSATRNYTEIQETGHFPFNVLVSGVSGIWDTVNNRYDALGEGQLVKFKASFNVSGTDGYQAYVQFYNTGDPYSSQSGVNYIALSSTPQMLVQEFEVRLKRNDKISVNVIVPQVGGINGDLTVYADDTQIECTATDQIINDSWVVPYNMLPDVKQLDFVKAVRHLFNLWFFTDMNMKTVYIEPRDTFYRRDKYIDLTGKLDLSKEVVFEELGADMSKKLIFKYKEDGADNGVVKYNEDAAVKFSEYTEELLNRFSSDGETAIENPMFAPTLMDTWKEVGFPVSKLPKIWGEPDGADPIPPRINSFAPRILYYDGLRDLETGESWRFEGSVQTQFPCFFSFDDTTVNDDSLIFRPESGVPDLFYKHYENYIRTINYARKITAYFKLSAMDIQGLSTPDASGSAVKDFRSLVFFRYGGEVHHCRLESINDYQAGQNQSTKVVLVADVDNISQIVRPFLSSMTFTNDNVPSGNTYANGTIIRQASLWSECRGSNSGNMVRQGIQYGVGSLKSTYYQIERMFLFFDTSDIPDTAVIVEAYLDIYKIAGSTTQEVSVFEGLQSTILTTSNYQSFGSVLLGQSVTGSLGLRRIYLNAEGIAKISKTGWTKFCLRESYYDVGNSAPASYFETFKSYQFASPAAYRNSLTIKYK